MTITRKIVKSGYSFLTTLPRYWIEHNQLKKGSKIEMEITPEGELIIKKWQYNPCKESEN